MGLEKDKVLDMRFAVVQSNIRPYTYRRASTLAQRVQHRMLKFHLSRAELNGGTVDHQQNPTSGAVEALDSLLNP